MIHTYFVDEEDRRGGRPCPPEELGHGPLRVAHVRGEDFGRGGGEEGAARARGGRPHQLRLAATGRAVQQATLGGTGQPLEFLHAHIARISNVF